MLRTAQLRERDDRLRVTLCQVMRAKYILENIKWRNSFCMSGKNMSVDTIYRQCPAQWASAGLTHHLRSQPVCVLQFRDSQYKPDRNSRVLLLRRTILWAFEITFTPAIDLVCGSKSYCPISSCPECSLKTAGWTWQYFFLHFFITRNKGFALTLKGIEQGASARMINKREAVLILIFSSSF